MSPAERSEGSSAAPVRLETSEGIAVLTMANPERRNVLDAAAARALIAATERLAADGAEVRCAILTGSGGVFAAGADVNEIMAASTAENLAYNGLLREAMSAVAELPVPTIAALNGHALGGGLELALACTIRVAARHVRLGLPEPRLGIIPSAGGLTQLPRLLPRSAAARLLLTGDAVDGEQAAALGLVDFAVAEDEVSEKARELAKRIASAAPLAIRAIVDSLRRDAGVPVAEAEARTEARLRQLLDSEDRREGARAFLERREPRFRGR